jgi:hypothetical protein
MTAWHERADDLRQRQIQLVTELAAITRENEQIAATAASGDRAALKRIAQLAQRRSEISLMLEGLVQEIATATMHIAAEEEEQRGKIRTERLAELDEKLAARLTLIAGIERKFTEIAALFPKLSEMTDEILHRHRELGGCSPFLPPLTKDAVGGRLSNHLSEIGLSAWLPLPRPELPMLQASWTAAERAAQQSYQLKD